MDWNTDQIAQLQALWAAGHSTAEIGRRMGISKNAVVGKAHRLRLPARPSPIRKADPAAPQRAARPMSAPLPRPASVPIRPLPVMPSSTRTMPCCWPIGEPGTRSFHFCDEPAMSGKPYCTTHAQLAYVKLRDRREDAA